MRIGWVGLGVMGFPMAGHLAAAGHEMQVYNRSPEKAVRFVERHGGTACLSPAEAAHGCEFLMMCVGADDDVRHVVTAALDDLAPGGVIVDHTTASARVARDMAERAGALGRFFLDAPVSGGQSGAEKGVLTVMVGGEAAAFGRAAPLIEAYAGAVRLMGPSGAGQLTKMCNQISVAGLLQGLAEAQHFARRAGLDPAAVYAAISKGSAQSRQMDNRWATMAASNFEPGFTVDWMRKDLGLVLDEARANGAVLAQTALVDQFYAELQAMGLNGVDTSSLIARLERK